MTLLVLGLALWWATHLFPIFAPGVRTRLMSRMGETPYKSVFSAVTLGAVALMVVGYRGADWVDVWTPPAWTVHLNNLLMLLAVALMGARNTANWLRAKVRHPMLAGVKTWAAAHLLVNGDLASVVLFGGMLAWAVVALIGTNRRDGKDGTAPAATLAGNLGLLAGTLIVFGIIVFVHTWLGRWPFPHG